MNNDIKRYNELITGNSAVTTRKNGFNADNFLNDLGYGKS